MSKRAAIIITDADYVFLTTAWDTRTTQEVSIDTSEQLLADLDSVLGLASIGVLELHGAHREDAEKQIERVRAAIGEEP